MGRDLGGGPVVTPVEEKGATFWTNGIISAALWAIKTNRTRDTWAVC